MRIDKYRIQLKSIVLSICILVIWNSSAQTTIPSGLISGTWTKSSSPYNVTGDITVPKDSILTIEPGTVIEFQGNFGLKVDGILKVDGKLGDSIMFKAAANKTWAGIHFIDNWQSDTIRFNYCKFVNIGAGTKYKMNIFALRFTRGGPVKITNSCFFHDLKNVVQGGYIAIRANVGIIENVSIIGNTATRDAIGGINVDSSKYFSLKNIKFSLPLIMSKLGGDDIAIANFFANFGYLKSISNTSKSSMNLTLIDANKVMVEDVIFIDNSRTIISNSKNCKFKNCKFLNSSATTIKTSNNCTGTIFENCEIRNCGSNQYDQFGILYPCMNLQSSGPLFKNCLITESNWGMVISQKYGAGTPIFLNCNIYENKFVTAAIEGFPVFVNCNIQDNKTFYQNPFDTGKVAPYSGGISIFTEFYQSRPYFYNCLFWGNRDSLGNRASLAFFSNNSSVRADLYNCILQGDTTTGIGGYDDNTFKKFKVNPAYINYVNSSGIPPGFIDSASGDYYLTNTCSQTAYAINRGQQGNLLTQYPFSMLKSQYGIDIYNSTDLAGNARVMDDTIDIGCYESSGSKKALTLRGSYLDSTVCYGGSKTYDSKSFGTIQSYQWQKKQNNTITTVFTQNKLNLINQRTDGIQYRLKVSNTECMQLSDSSNWFTITVNNPNKKSISKNPNKDTIQLKETMVLSTTASGYSSILWSDNSNKATISFKGSDLGALGTYQFSIEARKSNGCVETDTVYITTKANVGIDNILNEAIKIYPNPSKDIIHITCKDNQSFKWMVYNASGQEVLRGNETESINLASVPSGVYMLRIQSKDLDQTVRVSKVEN